MVCCYAHFGIESQIPCKVVHFCGDRELLCGMLALMIQISWRDRYLTKPSIKLLDIPSTRISLHDSNLRSSNEIVLESQLGFDR